MRISVSRLQMPTFVRPQTVALFEDENADIEAYRVELFGDETPHKVMYKLKEMYPELEIHCQRLREEHI